jgi:hypothetical protein
LFSKWNGQTGFRHCLYRLTGNIPRSLIGIPIIDLNDLSGVFGENGSEFALFPVPGLPKSQK